jgi:hypothetical protein
MGVDRPEGCITDPSNTRLEEPRLGCRRMEASVEGRQDPEGAAATWMDGSKVSCEVTRNAVRSGTSHRHIIQARNQHVSTAIIWAMLSNR